MGIRKYKPTTPGRRGSSVADFAEVTRDTPEKSLIRPLHSKGGRNVHGRVTARHQGGGHKRAYRLIDFTPGREGRRCRRGSRRSSTTRTVLCSYCADPLHGRREGVTSWPRTGCRSGDER